MLLNICFQHFHYFQKQHRLAKCLCPTQTHGHRWMSTNKQYELVKYLLKTLNSITVSISGSKMV